MNEQQYQADNREVKKLYRSRRNKVIGGVCGGLAEYFEVDVAIIRILFVLLAFIKGIGLLVYLVALFVIPINPNSNSQTEEKVSQKSSHNALLIIGMVLVLIGLYYLLDNLYIFPHYWFYSFPFRLHWDLFWPLLLILVGVLYLVHISKKKKSPTKPEEEKKMAEDTGKRLLRSRKERKISGVCGGIALYFDIDPTIVRVLWVILTLLSSVIFGLIVYIVMAIVVPEGD